MFSLVKILMVQRHSLLILTFQGSVLANNQFVKEKKTENYTVAWKYEFYLLLMLFAALLHIKL